MIIHTVEAGDTVYGIAKKYNVSPTKILEDNDLTNPDRLVVGEKLVILFPTRSYTVKAGDTLEAIASRFDLPLRTLYRNNPCLGGEDDIYTGQILTLEYPDKPYGSLSVNGYAYPHIDLGTLRKTLPYLTYLTVFSARVLADGRILLPDDATLLSESKKYGVAPILLLTNISDGGGFSSAAARDILSNPAARIKMTEELQKALKARKYAGVEFDFEYVPADQAEGYANLIEDMRRRLSADGFCVFVSAAPKEKENQAGALYEGHAYRSLGESANGVRLASYEWGCAYGEPMPIAPMPEVLRVTDYALSCIPASKLSLGTASYGYDWTLPYRRGTRARSYSALDCVTLAAETNARIDYDEPNEAPYFTYYDTSEKTPVQHVVYFEDAQSVQAKLALIGELGLSGVSLWNIMQYFPQYFLVLNALFDIVRPFPCTTGD